MRAGLLRSVVVAVIGVGSLLFAAGASAATITVNSTADPSEAGKCTLRDAINSANYNSLVPPPTFGTCTSGSVPSPDTINFSLGSGPHTIQLDSQLPAIANDTTITGPGAGLLTVRGELGTENYTVMPIQDEGTAPFPSVTLEGMTLTNGSRGISINAANALTLNNMTVSGNQLTASDPSSAVFGGAGIDNSAAAPTTITGSTIKNNSVTVNTTNAGSIPDVFNLALGAAINLSQGGNLSITGSTISGNTTNANGNQTAQAYGAIYTQAGAMTISRSTISGNTSTATVSEAGGAGEAITYGGGVLEQGGFGDALSLDRVTITGNTAATVTSSASGNGTAYGGGVLARQFNGGSMYSTATGSTIAGNTVSETGPGTSFLRGSNIDMNVNDVPGEELILENTIIANGIGTGATNCATESDARFGSNGYNLETSTGAGSTDTDECMPTPASGDQTGVSSSNLNLGSLQDNGGVQGNGDPVLTMAPGVASYAVDQGFAASATEDQRGFARTFNMNPTPPTGGDNTDIGAFEQQISQSVTDNDFGSLPWGTTSTPLEVGLTNRTGNSITPGTLSFGGTNPGDFQLSNDNCSNTALGNLSTCTVDVAFHPVSTGNGARSASLSLPTNVAPALLVNPLSGTVTEFIGVGPTTHDFGSTQTGTPTGATQFTATNLGPGTSGTLSAALTGANASEFGITQDNCTGQTLASGGTCTVSVRFAPSTTGAKAASLAVFAGVPSAALTGTGTAPPAPPPTTTTPAPTATKKKCKKKKSKKSAQASKKCKKKK